jgi:hypothetical protein
MRTIKRYPKIHAHKKLIEFMRRHRIIYLSIILTLCLAPYSAQAQNIRHERITDNRNMVTIDLHTMSLRKASHEIIQAANHICHGGKYATIDFIMRTDRPSFSIQDYVPRDYNLNHARRSNNDPQPPNHNAATNKNNITKDGQSLMQKPKILNSLDMRQMRNFDYPHISIMFDCADIPKNEGEYSIFQLQQQSDLSDIYRAIPILR